MNELTIRCPICVGWDGYNERCPGCDGTNISTEQKIKDYLASRKQFESKILQELAKAIAKLPSTEE